MTRIDDEIRPLVGIRAVATIWVVLFHMHAILALLLPSARDSERYLASALLAVDLFFVLSGFILTYRYLDRLADLSLPEVGHYLLLRFARIWPVHAVMVLAFVGYDAWSRSALGYGLSAENTDARNVLLNLLMLHELPPASAINPPSWSLAPEAGAYLVFPLLAFGLVRLRSPRVAFAGALLLVVAGSVLLWSLYAAQGAEEGASYTISWTRIAVCFPTGCLLAIGWRELPAYLQRNRTWDQVALGCAAGTVFLIWAIEREGAFAAPVVALPLLALLVLACAGATGPVADGLGHPLMEWGGRISYSVYLTHYLVIIIVFSRLRLDHAEDYAQPVKFLCLVGTLLLTLVVGVAAYYAIEEPSRRALRRVGRRARVSATVPGAPG